VWGASILTNCLLRDLRAWERSLFGH
jgi:hypothetical protein